MKDNYMVSSTIPRGGTAMEPEIQAASPSQKASEAVGYLREVESALASLREKLYGPFPQPGDTDNKLAQPPSLDDRLTEICQRAACIAGEVKSILGRL